ncbi:MAG: DNA topoisomerase IB, partial [Candidatus Limnocylindrales bacterium]
ERLPRIRAAVETDLGRPGLPREKVLAAVVRLLELTFIRVGNDEYARLYRSFGLTTLRNRHANVDGTRIRFRFRGKSGRQHDVSLQDRRLATVVRRCRDLPGQELFGYLDEDGEVRDVTSDDVNAYIREASGIEASAKDFRTWAGTVLAFRALRAVTRTDGPADARRQVVAAVRETADHLGNTPAVARASYVHPAVLDGYLDDGLRRALVRTAPATESTDEDEAAVIALLRRDARTSGAAAVRGAGRKGGAPRRKARAARKAATRPMTKPRE